MNDVLFDGTFADWKRAARELLAAARLPEDIRWIDRRSGQEELAFEGGALTLEATRADSGPYRVPRKFMALADEASRHRSAERWALLYRILWRITHDDPHLLEVAVDDDVSTLHAMAKAVRRDEHKMRAFVRFREVPTQAGPWFVAWFEPQHFIVKANATFFVERFPEMRWSILTPDECVHWDAHHLRFTAGMDRTAAPRHDAMEDLWRTYYASIFNPARLKLSMMQKEMPRKYWHNLPEARLIAPLAAQAMERSGTMIERPATQPRRRVVRISPVVPAVDTRSQVESLAGLGVAVEACRDCPIGHRATQAVPGEGPQRAALMLVGEQPGDQEDLRGRPFVGPAGQLLARAMERLALRREDVFLTNAVRHFKFELRGKRRIHKTPAQAEAAACSHWLEEEIALVQPQVIVALGATAARSLLGRPVAVTAERGNLFVRGDGRRVLVTWHPSALLLMEPAQRGPAIEDWVAHLVSANREVLLSH